MLITLLIMNVIVIISLWCLIPTGINDFTRFIYISSKGLLLNLPVKILYLELQCDVKFMILFGLLYKKHKKRNVFHLGIIN